MNIFGNDNVILDPWLVRMRLLLTRNMMKRTDPDFNYFWAYLEIGNQYLVIILLCRLVVNEL